MLLRPMLNIHPSMLSRVPGSIMSATKVQETLGQEPIPALLTVEYMFFETFVESSWSR